MNIANNIIKLGDVTNITKLAGFEHTEYIQPNATSERKMQSDVPMYIGLNIQNGHLLEDIHWYIPEELSLRLERSALTTRCIVLPYVGSVGDLAIFDGKTRHHLASNVAKIELVNENHFSIDYLYYYLKSPYGQKQLLYYIQGGVQKNITMDAIRKTEINVVSNHNKVVEILSTLDTKIELNNKINAELEQMAKTLYDYWFVQFDFPDENGKPYKSSGGKVVWSEELKREIPEGWVVKKLKEIFEFEKGIEPGSSEYLDYSINGNCIKFFRVKDIEGESSVYVDSSNKKYVIAEESDVIVTFDGSVGKLGFGLSGAISGGLRKIYSKSKKIDNSLAYFIFRDERIIATIHKYATGSILLHASSSIDHLKIPFEEYVYLKYQEITKPIFEQMVKNKQENQKLSELRDWLLPMLMNEQVTIN